MKPISDKWIANQLALMNRASRNSPFLRTLKELAIARERIRTHKSMEARIGQFPRPAASELYNATLPEGDK